MVSVAEFLLDDDFVDVHWFIGAGHHGTRDGIFGVVGLVSSGIPRIGEACSSKKNEWAVAEHGQSGWYQDSTRRRQPIQYQLPQCQNECITGVFSNTDVCMRVALMPTR